VGTKVRVLGGPFAGRVGVIRELDGRGSARVALGLLSARVLLENLRPAREVDRPRWEALTRHPVPQESVGRARRQLVARPARSRHARQHDGFERGLSHSSSAAPTSLASLRPRGACRDLSPSPGRRFSKRTRADSKPSATRALPRPSSSLMTPDPPCKWSTEHVNFGAHLERLDRHGPLLHG